MTTNRDSNMEFLRIIAILFVLIGHASSMAFGRVQIHDATFIENIFSFSRLLMFSVTQAGVNLFVLISGWYGIKYSNIKLLKLIFQILFSAILVAGVLIAVDLNRHFNLYTLGSVLLLSPSDLWFVKAYIGLFILAPALNYFIEHCSEEHFRIILLLFYVFQTIYGYLSISGAQWIEGGFSAWSFIGLYLLARYVRLYPNRFTTKSIKFDAFVYASIVLSLAILAYVLLVIGIDVQGRLVGAYTNPLSIISSVYLLLFFSKIHLRSKVVNWIAASCFAVYLLHSNELVLRLYFGPFVKWLYDNNPWIIFILSTIVFILVVFIVSIMIDRIRMVCWNKISNRWLSRNNVEC